MLALWGGGRIAGVGGGRFARLVRGTVVDCEPCKGVAVGRPERAKRYQPRAEWSGPGIRYRIVERVAGPRNDALGGGSVKTGSPEGAEQGGVENKYAAVLGEESDPSRL